MEKSEIIAVTKTMNLLYVEDDEHIRESSNRLFSSFFSKVTVANDGLDALEKYAVGTFDIIITDLAMPNMDGIEMIKSIRQDNPKIPVIVYSALDNGSYITACISLNVDSYITKPMMPNNLIESLEKVVYKVTALKGTQQTADSISEKFYTDELTGLKSHNALMSKIESVSMDETPVLILLNINEFRLYNELYGLHSGDMILNKFAMNLKNFCDKYNYDLYRMGGDEFVLFDNTQNLNPKHYEDDINLLLDHIDSSPIKIDGVDEDIHLFVNIGISFDRENAYGKADMALHEARKQGKQYLGFNSESDLRKDLISNLYWREEISKAIKENRVHAFYQPIVDRGGKVIRYESLMRIKQNNSDGTSRVVSPIEFLDFSKASKQYVGLTDIIIKESFKTMIEKNVHVAINLTFQDMENDEINQLLRERIIKNNLSNKTKFDISSQVIFELLDHPSNEGYDRFVEFINEFRSLGVLITIDNFGLGFSNISKVASLAPNYVKIDSALIKNIDSDKHSYSLVKAIVKFTKELGIRTVAEYITTKEIFDTCKELDIDEFQGYYFSEPTESIEENGYKNAR